MYRISLLLTSEIVDPRNCIVRVLVLVQVGAEEKDMYIRYNTLCSIDGTTTTHLGNPATLPLHAPTLQKRLDLPRIYRLAVVGENHSVGTVIDYDRGVELLQHLLCTGLCVQS